MRIAKQILILSGVVVASVGLAGSVDLQTWADNGSVRIVHSNTTFNGSGTIIDHKRGANGTGWLCILTADHVVSVTGAATGATFGTIGFALGNGANANLTAAPTANASWVARKAGAAVDLAILAVNYGAYDASYSARVKSVEVGGTSARDITSIGYGSSATYVPQLGYARTPNSWQTQRYVNNKAETYAIRTPFGGYTFDAMEWDVDDRGAATSVVGEASIMDGDSGGGVFESQPINDNRFNPEPLVFSNRLIGVNSYGQIDYTDANYPGGLIRFGYTNGAVRITPAYKTWIENQCQAVPEPSSMAALTLGAVAFLRRRVRSTA